MALVLPLALAAPAVSADFEDPFGEASVQVDSIYDVDSRVLFYQQYNDGRDRDVNKKNTQLALDMELSADWSANWSGMSRIAWTGNKDDSNSEQRSDVLEAYAHWQSDSLQWQFLAGRVKTQWSNGYNWNVANMLRPYRDRPYLDEDNLQQLKGWDLLSASFNTGAWQISTYVVALDDDEFTGDYQSVLRLAYTGDIDWSVLTYHAENEQTAWAANISSAVGNHWTFRGELAADPKREQPTTPLSDEQSYYLKAVAGVAYQADSAGQLSVEYLYNEHGYSAEEWDFIKVFIDLDSSSEGDARGQLRKNYIYLQYLSDESLNLWQYRQSMEINLDDNSQLHRVELKKAFTDAISARIQLEYFKGCATCEYGLPGLTTTSRLALYWSF
ncbi:MAG: hypothetical protein HRU20_32005 [Pseudomonadales bacterium]|nr:hypothetical protein [Pseudomonadales bacterium]